MTFFKVFQTNNYPNQITRQQARDMIERWYGEKNVDKHLNTLLREKHFELGYWTIIYKPTTGTYCHDQCCSSNPDNCGYYPSQCIKEKYNE